MTGRPPALVAAQEEAVDLGFWAPTQRYLVFVICRKCGRKIGQCTQPLFDLTPPVDGVKTTAANVELLYLGTRKHNDQRIEVAKLYRQPDGPMPDVPRDAQYLVVLQESSTPRILDAWCDDDGALTVRARDVVQAAIEVREDPDAPAATVRAVAQRTK